MASIENLITCPRLRLARQAQKEDFVLKFLRQHIWSTQDILQKVMKLTTRQGAHKYLLKLELKGYLKRHSYDALGGKLTIWGITYQGQSAAFDINSESLIPAYFEPNRISEQVIRHQLDLQKLRLVAESAGWTKWMDGDRLGIYSKDQKRPDAIVEDTNGMVVACECERSFKSLKRMEQILINYLKLIKSGQIDHVVWICPTDEMAARIRKIFTSIKYVSVNGQKILIEPEKHHKNLYFCSYSAWPNYHEPN